MTTISRMVLSDSTQLQRLLFFSFPANWGRMSPSGYGDMFTWVSYPINKGKKWEARGVVLSGNIKSKWFKAWGVCCESSNFLFFVSALSLCPEALPLSA